MREHLHNALLELKAAREIAEREGGDHFAIGVEDRSSGPGSTKEAIGLARQEFADLEERLVSTWSGILAALGYPARGVPEQQPAIAPNGRQVNRQDESTPQATANGSPVTERNGKESRRQQLAPIFEYDPVTLGRLKPNSSLEMHVLGRRVVMEVDGTGRRPVIGQPTTGEKTLAVYGCSFTFGTAITAEETFCSLLQGMFPHWRAENHGVPGYSTSRNLIQLERETPWNPADLVTFCWIEQHLSRNVADIAWVQKMSENNPQPPNVKVAGQRMLRAALGSDGALEMRSIRVPRYDLMGIDFSDFATDRYYLDLVCFQLFERANKIVTSYGGHFFVTTLQGKLSASVKGWLANAGIPVVDASLMGDEYLCLPDDPHPNALANRIYAERIRDYLLMHTGGSALGQEAG
jgi:hypothetical protein